MAERVHPPLHQEVQPPGGRHGIMPGHEMAGRIHALGDGVKTDWAGVPVKAGDRIAPVYYSVCNRCSNCVAGSR